MRGRVRGVTGHRVDALSDGWEFCGTAPGAIEDASALGQASLDWRPTIVPSTAASSMRSAGVWSLDHDARRFDAEDWWYRTRFAAEPAEQGEQLWLCFDGLATIADVWLNGSLIVSSDNMFVAHERRVDDAVRSENELAIRFRSLDALLGAKRPRPRWRAPMVENQQLRWFRTTLLGRTPGWSPPAAVVGPWRGVRLERRRRVAIDDVRVRSDAAGRLDVACSIVSLNGGAIAKVELIVEREGREHRVALALNGSRAAGGLVVPDVEHWWPHTHGEPALYSARLRVTHAGGETEADLGAVGFRTIAVDTRGDDFAVTVNGTPIFCRGACWTPLDVMSLSSAPAELDAAFDQVTTAGMNMLRVSGTLVYESDEFLDRCDERGVLLWQDLMFANMDYPEGDADFVATASEEVRQLLARVQGRASLAVICGNSEGEQQAAMWGAPRERWRPAFFHERLANLAADACPDVQYWPSSAHGGAFPHQGNSGTTSYYGVGAYLRPIEDARRAEVRFASECLAFANVPEPRATDPGVDTPAWKARTPRDLGASWDFEDVRDHYVAALFRVDGAALRMTDPERYLALARVATGEVMSAVFAEWRRSRSATRGGLVWFLRDLWPGAGWGVIDARGTPKAAWHYLRRALAPLAMSLSDEGGNGMSVHVVNDTPAPWRGMLEVSLYRDSEVRVGCGEREITVEARSAIELNAASLFDHLFDVSYAYRFGPPSHDLVVATLRDGKGQAQAEAFHFPLGLPNASCGQLGLTADARPRGEGGYELIVRTRTLAQSVHVAVDGFVADDDYFHLAPGAERRLVLRASGDARAELTGSVRALNAESPVTIMVAS